MVPSTKSYEQRLTTSQQSRNLCPHCGSEHVIKASAAYEQGTSTIAGKTQQIGAMLIQDSGGGFDVAPGVSGGSFSGVQQTTLASRLSPPAPPKEKHGGVIIALGGVMVLVSLPLFNIDDIGALAVLFLAAGIVVIFVGAANLEPKEKYAQAVQQHRTQLDL